MSKYEYKAEYEIKASPKMIYHYLSTPNGLSEWFAQKVVVRPDKTYDIYWNNEGHLARIISQRTNHMIRFQFLKDDEDSNYLEFRLGYNEFTESTFLTVIDYSEMSDEEQLNHLWDGLVERLQGLIGG